MKKVILSIYFLSTVLSPAFSVTPSENNGNKPAGGNTPASFQFMNTSRNSIYPEWGYYFVQSTGLSVLANPNLSSDIWNNKGGLGFTFDAGFFRSFGPIIRIKAGLGISYHNSALEGNGEITGQNFKDIDGDSYNEILTLTDANNKVNPIYLSVPLSFELGNLGINRTGFYLEGGVNYSYLIYSVQNSSGTYTTKGSYDQWGLVLENVEELGFYSGRNLKSGTDFLKNNLSLFGGIGVTIPLSTQLIFRFGIKGSFGLLDIGNNKPSKPENEPITGQTFDFRVPYIDNSYAVMPGTKTRFIGIDIGMYFSKQLK